MIFFWLNFPTCKATLKPSPAILLVQGHKRKFEQIDRYPLTLRTNQIKKKSFSCFPFCYPFFRTFSLSSLLVYFPRNFLFVFLFLFYVDKVVVAKRKADVKIFLLGRWLVGWGCTRFLQKNRFSRLIWIIFSCLFLTFSIPIDFYFHRPRTPRKICKDRSADQCCCSMNF